MACQALNRLNALATQAKKDRHPNYPASYVVPAKFTDSSANELSKAVLAWFRLHGHFATRVSTTGQYRKDAGGFVKGNTRKGMSDIVSCVAGATGGVFVAAEIKYGKDYQSQSEKEVQREIEQCGGHYLLVRTFADFERQILSVIQQT